MPRLWEVRTYVSPEGEDEIRTWYEEQPKNVQGKFWSRLRTLSQLPPDEWKLPLFRWLHGNCRPLGEVRFEVKNVQYRPLGFRTGRVFTLTFCAKEKDDDFVPKTACKTALERMQEIKQNKDRSHALWLALE